MNQYIHKETGMIDTADGWIASYTADELTERGLALTTGNYVTLFETKEGYNAQD